MEKKLKNKGEPLKIYKLLWYKVLKKAPAHDGLELKQVNTQ